MERLPDSVSRAIWLLRAVVVWTGVTALLTYVFRDDIVTTWAEGNPAAAEILTEGGLDALRESSIDIPGFVPLAIVLLVVFGSLALVLVAFLRGRHRWAQVALSVTVLLAAFSTAVGLGRDVPALFAAISAVALVLYAALLFYLWHKDTRAYLRAP